MVIRRASGKLRNLEEAIRNKPVDGSFGIGHTRWATHGGPTDQNAHPHRGGDDGKLALIHNGIIENFHSLKTQLLADGVGFASETDTEVAAQLLAQAYAGDLTEAMRTVVNRLEGAFTLLAVHADNPGVVVGARHERADVDGPGGGDDGVDYLVSTITIADAEAIALVRAGKVELSIGFSTLAVDEPGDFDGIPYRYRQTAIEGNHFALF